MTDEQINQRIAEACGWQNCVGGSGLVTRYKGTPSETTVRVTLPDYLNDLNAMHEVVMTLSVKQRSEFRNQLQYLIAPSTKPNQKVSGIKVMGVDHYDEWWHATAAQRAEAFLRTIGKWEETK
jgi:hypothetical protein